MLRRDRQIRTQIHQLADALLFAVSFWVAYALRTDPRIVAWLGLPALADQTIDSDKIIWLYAALFPAAPLILESQDFYNRPSLGSRAAIFWPLFKGCVITTIGLVLAMYVFHFVTPRGMILFFGVISFSLVYLKEELVRWVLLSKLAQSQYKRRFVLVGTEREIARMRNELKPHNDESVEVIAEFNLIETPVQQIVQLLHDHSVFGVILSAKHTNFEQVEYVIRACELEGVEVWLIADFFSTQISRTSFDELLGRPLLVFRTAPETSWQSLVKQFMDFFGAVILLVVLSPVFLFIAIWIKLTSPGPVFFRQQRSGHERRAVHALQIPHHGHQRRAVQARARGDERNDRPRLQGHQRPAHHARRKIPPQIQPRRTAAALQRPARRDEPRRPAPAARGRSQTLRRPRPPPPLEREARHSPASGRSAGATRFPTSRTGCGSTSNTLTTGRSGST